MYELVQVAKNSYYIDCPAKIGIYKSSDNGVYLIDSGNDKDAGRKVRQILDMKGWKLKAILNTHSNADHIGGNQYLQKQTDCKIFANKIEAAFTNYPLLEPSFLFGGFPGEKLRHKFLMAQESTALDISDCSFPQEIRTISLPGHFFDMVGYITPDNVAFLADCLSSKDTLDKYGITFVYDVEAYIETLERIKEIKADTFVPSHAEATQDIKELAQYNIDKAKEVSEKIISLCQKQKTHEEILAALFDYYHLKMSFEQYVLVGSTVKSYLSWLCNTGKVKYEFVDNKMLWKAID